MSAYTHFKKNEHVHYFSRRTWSLPRTFKEKHFVRVGADSVDVFVVRTRRRRVDLDAFVDVDVDACESAFSIQSVRL